MDILAILGHIASIHSVLQITSKVAQFVSRNRQSLDHLDEPSKVGVEELQKKIALKTTLDEWERIATTVEPGLQQELMKIQNAGTLKKAETLAKLADLYAQRNAGVPTKPSTELKLNHTKLGLMGDGRVRIYLGQSNETRPLQGQSFNIRLEQGAAGKYRVDQASIGGDMALPIFKVTMLGGSESGKTVFMSAMYTMLRQSPDGISLWSTKFDDNIKLGRVMEEIRKFNRWPLGTQVAEIKYEFELKLKNIPVCRVDWVDYRGGILTELSEDPDHKDEVATLRKRLRESDAIIWMVDMLKLEKEGINRINSFDARMVTGVDNMASLCSDALDGTNDARSWIFVRTKSDTVRNTRGEPDFSRAVDELLEHLGSTLDIYRNHKHSRAAAIPVSSTGRLKADGSREGDDPSQVQWPLAISLAFLLEAKYNKSLEEDGRSLVAEYESVRSNRFNTFFRNVLALGPKSEEERVLNRMDDLGVQLYKWRSQFEAILQKRPDVVRLLD